MRKSVWFLLTVIGLASCTTKSTSNMNVFETSANGNLHAVKKDFKKSEQHSTVSIDTKKRKQTIIGFGGAFTESTAHNINLLSPENRTEIIDAYFGEEGAAYSLTRTHMNSCDFSVANYSYTPVEGDTALEHFSIEPDRADILPMIKDAQAVSKDGFKIFGSPWSAAPWMKDNNSYVGGKLKKEFYDTWALFFSKYVDAYRAEGIDIWGFTVENEPHGNGNNWESMHYSPEEMTDFVVNHLGPQLEADGKGDLIIMGYDQNRQGAPEWANVMYRDDTTKRYYDGMVTSAIVESFDSNCAVWVISSVEPSE